MVAAYARVSTDLEEQQSSYQAQIDYYTNYIQGRADWEFVGMYADEGISGTSTKHRQGFQTMITDALAGRIDLIVTKSVSRFARNTVDSLTSVRALKEAGVEVYFEKENIWTLDSKGELLITIMSSLAQEESRSISENVTWGHRRRFAEGKVMVPYASLLGYKKGDDGGLAVDEDQARIVRRIYREYLAGHSPKTIAAHLTKDGIPTPLGKKTWSVSTINSILRNEGEIPQYYVTGNHEPIIAPAVWDQVQHELARRSGRSRSFSHLFASKIECGCCGGWYGPKTWHAGSRYERRIWRCNRKYDPAGDQPCATKHVTEDELIAAFEQATSQLAPPPSPEVLEAALTVQPAPLLQRCRTRNTEAHHRLRFTHPTINHGARCGDLGLIVVSGLLYSHGKKPAPPDHAVHLLPLSHSLGRHTKPPGSQTIAKYPLKHLHRLLPKQTIMPQPQTRRHEKPPIPWTSISMS